MADTMVGCDTLNGWDCLVSYSEDAINSLLAERATALGVLDPLTWTAQYKGIFSHLIPDPWTGAKYS